MSKKKDIITTSGTRKRAVARASLKKGTGMVRVNDKSLDFVEPHFCQMKIKEPLILAGDVAKTVNITVKVHGGGSVSQSDAARVAISRALAEFEPKLKGCFQDYDRNLLVADVRRKEKCKPNDSKARAKRQKSYR
jgi:small subunit ribosomal protein S9